MAFTGKLHILSFSKLQILWIIKCITLLYGFFLQAYNLSRDHKPDLEIEKERILKAGGFIHAGRVNGSLNLARAIGNLLITIGWSTFLKD